MFVNDLFEKKKGDPAKPRNFVAKNAKMGGAGAHKDKKKAEKQGDVKHKKDLAADLAESNRGYEHGFASPTAPSLRGRRQFDEPDAVNNIEISINGRPWKVFAGKGLDSSPEFFKQKQMVDAMCKRKTAETGKKWSWGVTGAPATNEAEMGTKHKENRFKAIKQRDQQQDQITHRAMNNISDEVAEGLNEFAPGGGGDDDHQDPYGTPKPKHYDRSIDFFGQFEADHFDKEDMNDATGVFRGYWGRDQIAYFKFDNPRRTGSDDPGVGWYYEPTSDGNSKMTSAEPAVDNSNDREQQELSMIKAFLKSGQKPNPGSQIYNLMKRHGMAEATGDEKFDTMMGRIQQEPKYPDPQMPPTDVKDLYQWAVKNNKPYHKIFAKWANREGFKSVAPALHKAGTLDSDALDYWTPRVWKIYWGEVRGIDSEMPPEWAKKRIPDELRDYLETVFDAYDHIVFDWPTEYRQIGQQGVAEGVAETLSLDDALKVLRQYGAGHFKTTSNELHFYKNGRPFSVDLIWNDDATRSVSLSNLNSATRGLKGQGVAEVAPPGDKAERMVKHIKKGYAKDGKLTPKEKSIAYATAWKAHNKEINEEIEIRIIEMRMNGYEL